MLALFRTGEKAVAERRFESDPGVPLRVAGAPAGGQIAVAAIAAGLNKGRQASLHGIAEGEIDGVVAVAGIEGGAIDEHAADGLRNDDIGIGIPVAVGVGGEIVVEEKAVDVKELGDRFAVVACDSGREVLGRLDAS